MELPHERIVGDVKHVVGVGAGAAGGVVGAAVAGRREVRTAVVCQPPRGVQFRGLHNVFVTKGVVGGRQGIPVFYDRMQVS